MSQVKQCIIFFLPGTNENRARGMFWLTCHLCSVTQGSCKHDGGYALMNGLKQRCVVHFGSSSLKVSKVATTLGLTAVAPSHRIAGTRPWLPSSNVISHYFVVHQCLHGLWYCFQCIDSVFAYTENIGGLALSPSPRLLSCKWIAADCHWLFKGYIVEIKVLFINHSSGHVCN